MKTHYAIFLLHVCIPSPWNHPTQIPEQASEFGCLFGCFRQVILRGGRDRPRALQGIISFGLSWSLLSFPAEELEQLATWRENWASLLRLLPPQTGPRYMTEDVCRYRWMDEVTYDIKYIKIWDECRGAKAKGEYHLIKICSASSSQFSANIKILWGKHCKATIVCHRYFQYIYIFFFT